MVSSVLLNGWVEDVGTGLLFSALAARLLVVPCRRAWTNHRRVMTERHEELLEKHDEHGVRLKALERRQDGGNT